jgi:predicted nucleic acid-binding protein
VTLRYLLDTSVVSAPIAPVPAPSIVRDFARFQELAVEQWGARR